MKNKILALIVAGLALLNIQILSADVCTMDGWYVAASGSASWHNRTKLTHFTNVKYKTGFGGNASLGLIIDSCWRFELEGVFRYYNNDHVHNESNSFKVTNHGYLREVFGFLNLLYDISLTECLDLYLGGGIGLAKAHLKLRDRSSPDTLKSTKLKFAYQFLSGFAYDINDCWALTLGYRYLAMAKPGFHKKHEDHHTKLLNTPYSNNVDLGLRYKF